MNRHIHTRADAEGIDRPVSDAAQCDDCRAATAYLHPALPAGSPRLRDRRYQIDIARKTDRIDPANGKNIHIVHTTLRYATLQAALDVAIALPDDDEHALVNVTYFSARDGWKAHPAAQRKQGETWTTGA